MPGANDRRGGVAQRDAETDRRLGADAAVRLERLRSRVPWAVAWAVRLVAVASVLTLLTRPEGGHHRMTDALLDGLTTAVVISLAGLALVLARGLARRKRRAWRIVLGLTVVATALYLRAHAWPSAALNLALVSALLWTRRDFTARSEPATRWLAVRAGLLTATVAIVAGLAITRRTAPTADLGPWVGETLAGMFGFVPDLPYRRPELGDFTSVALTALGVAVLGVVLLIVLAPRRKPAVLGAQEEDRARGLLARHGSADSLGYFALRRDKSVVFSDSGKAAIAYRVVGGVTLAAGDPLGDKEAWPGAINAWLAEADQYAWTPGVLGASRDGATAYVRAGLDALEVGDEAVLDLTSFSLSGREMRPVRQAVNRVERAGYVARTDRQSDLTPEDLTELTRVVDGWRDGEVERGFSMALGRVGDDRDPDIVVARARDAEGNLVAVLTLVPWGADGLSLDLMRRSRDSENGTNEFLVAAVAAAAADLGVRRLSLNFAVFRSALERGGEVGAGPVLRLWRSVLLTASRWWQIESLYRANAKYQPEWVPRFVCFPRAADLAHVVVAALQAEAFVVRPSLSRWWRPRR